MGEDTPISLKRAVTDNTKVLFSFEPTIKIVLLESFFL